MASFKRAKMVSIWQTLYAIIMRCLTSISKGTDAGNLNAFKFLVGIVKHMHLDYSVLIFEDLQKIVHQKQIPRQAKTFLPYPRFLSMIVQQLLIQFPDDIHRRDADPAPTIFRMQKLYKMEELEGVKAFKMPVELLMLMDLDDPIIKAYVKDNKIALPKRQEPAASTPRALDVDPESLGDRSQSPAGESDREEQSQNKERGGEVDEGDESVGEGEMDDDMPLGHFIEKSQSQSQGTPDPIIEMNVESLIVTPPAPKVISLEQRVETPKQVAATSPSYSHDFIFDIDDVDTGDLYVNILNVAKDSVDEVERLKETESERVRKEQERAERLPAIESREATSATGSDIVSPGIEKVLVIPTEHAHTPPGYSISS